MFWDGKINPILDDDFFGLEATKLAPKLLGCVLHTYMNERHTAGIITETEAYHECEKGCHAYQGKRTARTEVMFGAGGNSYVYLCYGIHHLFNVVCGPEGSAQAVLIRTIDPFMGKEEILKRRNKTKFDKNCTNGPGKVSQALGIHTKHSSISLKKPPIWIEYPTIRIDLKMIKRSPRIGIDYAGEDALLKWRYYL